MATDQSSGWDINGWVYLEDSDSGDYMWVAVNNYTWDVGAQPEGEDLPSDSHYGYDLGTRERYVVLKGVLFGAISDLHDFLSYMDSWQNNGAMTLKIKYDSSNYVKFDGSSTTLSVFFMRKKGITKVQRKTDGLCKINSVRFKQFG
jgi:hypothetical protein